MKKRQPVPVWDLQLHDRSKLQEAQITNVIKIQKLGVSTEVLFAAMAIQSFTSGTSVQRINFLAWTQSLPSSFCPRFSWPLPPHPLSWPKYLRPQNHPLHPLSVSGEEGSLTCKPFPPIVDLSIPHKVEYTLQVKAVLLVSTVEKQDSTPYEVNWATFPLSEYCTP